MTLCFSLFLALSLVLGQLIPVSATDEVPAEVPVEETGIPEAEPVQPDPEPTEEEPGVPPEGETPASAEDEGTPVPTDPAGDGQGEFNNSTDDMISGADDNAETIKYGTVIKSQTVGNVEIIATYDWTSGLNENAQMNVREIPDNSEEYKNYLERVKAVTEGDNTFAHFFDIWFTVNGEKVQPTGKVNIEFNYLTPQQKDSADSIIAVHFGEGSQTEILGPKQIEQTETDVRSVEVEATSFSIYGIMALASDVAPGETLNLNLACTGTLKGTSSFYSSYWSSSDDSIATVTGNGSTATVLGKKQGTVTIIHTYGSWNNQKTEQFTVKVSNLTPVYVFVAAVDDKEQPYSDEMLELLQVTNKNDKQYFAAGTVLLDLSKFTKGSVKSKLTDDADWDELINQIKNNTDSHLITGNSNNPKNTVADYLTYVERDYSAAPGSVGNRKSGMWITSLDTSSVGGNTFIGGAVDSSGNPVAPSNNHCWHLDFRFQCVHINYVYGKNNIDSGECKDYNPAGTKVFIKGAQMDKTPELGELPEGYKVAGYYTTDTFDPGTEWDGIYKPITEDTDVYIKIVPKDNAVINYVVQEGNGTVTDPSQNDAEKKSGTDSFNPDSNPKGSTAKPAEGWEFEGWYSNQDCTNLVTKDLVINPIAPQGGWQETTNITYYAKFVQTTKTLVVSNTVDGNAGDKEHYFNYQLIILDSESKIVETKEFKLKHGETSEVFEYPSSHTYVVKQTDGLDHDTTATGKRRESEIQHGTYTKSEQKHEGDLQDHTIVEFTNIKDIPVPSGLNDHDSAIHGFVLSAGAGLLLIVAIVALRRRMNAI